MENERRLYRSRFDSVLGGVSGGLGKYFSIDPLIIRILFLVFAFFIGGGVIAYIILWIAMPLEPDYFSGKYGRQAMGDADSRADYDATAEAENQSFSPINQPRSNNKGALIAGTFLIVFGAILIADRFIYQINFRDLWPFLVVLVGVFIIAGSFRK